VSRCFGLLFPRSKIINFVDHVGNVLWRQLVSMLMVVARVVMRRHLVVMPVRAVMMRSSVMEFLGIDFVHFLNFNLFVMFVG
jgi:hypothetical protein